MLKNIEIVIRESLKEKGYTNKLINYEEFLKLYEPYKNEMAEVEFAEIIGIAYANYCGIKNKGTRAKVLKRAKNIPEEREEEIREDLIKQGYRNKAIDYQELLELYRPYQNEMTEIEFAEIIGITYYNYCNIKNKGQRAIILKEEKKIPEERKEEIRRDLKEKGYSNKLIDYEEFLKLYEPYRNEMQDTEFAEIIGISAGNYSAMKNKGRRATILKEENITKERKEEIRKDLREKGYSSKLIDYEEFLKLYEPYQNEMQDTEFAEIIGIACSGYSMMKNRGRRRTILKEKKSIIKERKEEIRKDLKEKGYSNKLINYEEFLKLYEPYQNEMTEIEFAEIIGIAYYNYCNIKNKGQRAKILKEEKKILEERKEEIRKDLREKGYSSKLIDYEEFLKLYEPYRNEMQEKDFAEILGILYASYMQIKHYGKRAKINFKHRELANIKYKLKLESREYKKEELEEICGKYGVSLYELLLELCSSIDAERLINKKTVYIGRCRMPEDFLQKHSKELMQLSQSISANIGQPYKRKIGEVIDDVASETLLGLMEKRGDLVKNSETDEEAIEIIRRCMIKLIKYKYINMLKARGAVSLDKNIGSDRKKTRYDIVKVQKKPETETEEEIERNEESIVEDMKRCYGESMKTTEALAYVRKKYGLSRKELLKILEQEISKKRRIVKSPNGKVYLGEEYDD